MTKLTGDLRVSCPCGIMNIECNFMVANHSNLPEYFIAVVGSISQNRFINIFNFWLMVPRDVYLWMAKCYYPIQGGPEQIMQSSLDELQPRLPPACSTVKENIHRVRDINLRGLKVFLPSQWNSAAKACGTAGLCRHCIAIKRGRSPRHCKQHWLRHFKYVTLRLFLPLFSSPVKNYLFQLTKVESHKQQRDICIFKKWLTFPNSGSLYHHKLFPGVFKMSQVFLSLGMACQ